MKRISYLVVVTSVFLTLLGAVDAQQIPNRTGVFCNAEGDWREVESIGPSEIKNKNFVLGAITAGAIKHRTINVYRGEKSSIQLTESRPKFTLTGIDASSGNTVIVKLKKNKNTRELEIARVGFMGTGSGYGYKPSDTFDVSINRESNDALTVTSKSSLASGEYLLILGSGTQTEKHYDFGIK